MQTSDLFLEKEIHPTNLFLLHISLDPGAFSLEQGTVLLQSEMNPFSLPFCKALVNQTSKTNRDMSGTEM